MERIVFLDRNTVRGDLRPPSFAHEWVEYAETRADETIERLQGASVCITNKVRLGEAELSLLPHLRLIAVAATGVDNIELDACRKRGIRVSNVRDYSRHSVAEHVFTLLLALRRNLIPYHEDVRAGAWSQSSQFVLLTHTITDLRGSTLGIIAYGTIAREVERLARAFGIEVLVAERKGAREIRAGRTEFAEALRRSDAVTIHAPLNAETRGMIGEVELKLMPAGAILINCARGGIVDERALADALRAGKLAGAGVDVLTSEPPREGNPLLESDVPNLIVTPHVAWASREAMESLLEQVIESIEAFVRGEPRNLVA